MVSRLSGSPKDKELVVIETLDLTCVIKGPAEHPQYGKLRGYSALKVEDFMQFQCRAENATIQIFDVLSQELKTYSGQEFIPVFFENGQYELIIIPKTEEELTFYHEYPQFREAITKVSRTKLLTGILHFRNEVGLTSFEIRDSRNRRLLDVMLEIFPTKLDYKKDYKTLLNEVSEEVYNLAYHFIKRTYLQGSAMIFKDPSLSEFYRLMQQHYEQYIRAIDRIEKVSHHQLKKNYVEVRGSQLRKPDQKALAYLRRNASRFEEDVPNGIPIGDRTVMPTKGLLMKKEHTADTLENRYVKWTMVRITIRLKELKRVIEAAYPRGYSKLDNELMDKLDSMITKIEKRQKNKFWSRIGKLDRSIVSLILQMAPGYREVLVVYTTISKSIILQGEIYKMSVKDIATLYEYWTFLKLGQLLAEKCIPQEQDIVKVNSEGLFINLDKSKTAQRNYVHPVTGEKITLKYQYDTSNNRVPTVQQKPDSMLSIGKKGKDYQYQYIFDAKYRIDFETSSMPGPMQDDINTMHRYRDSIVVNTSGSYERTAFGAYVLFPWHDEDAYVNHPLYRSIDSVNIGGLPFLPNHTTLVDNFIDSLLNKSPEELQQEGILPKGSLEPVDLYSTDSVLICTVVNNEDIQMLLSKKEYKMKVADLQDGWQHIQYVASYENSSNQISFYGKVRTVDIQGEYIKFRIENWTPKQIIGMGYTVSNHTMVPFSTFQQANSLAELHAKSKEEFILWKIVNRISNNVRLNLDNRFIDQAKRIIAFDFDPYRLEMHHDEGKLRFIGKDFEEVITMDLILDNESYIFQRMVELIYPKSIN